MDSDRDPARNEPALTVVEILRGLAARRPDAPAYTFLVDGEKEEVHLTYAELDRQARAIAALLQDRGAAGQRVLLLYPPGLDYIAAFFGCLYAGTIAVPVYPPDPMRLARTLPRLRAIVVDSQPSLTLSTSTVLALAEDLVGQAPELQAQSWLATDEIPLDRAAAWSAPAIDRQSLAFLQYTSGSTAAPKSVMISHANILHSEEMIRRAFAVSERSTVVGWLPLYHDMGLIGNVLQSLYAGCRCILMSPLDFMSQPLRWLQAISRYRGTVSGGPNFAYDLCVRKIAPEERAALDLSSWRVAFNGSEPVRAETLQRFTKAFAPSGFQPTAFLPCYGLAEATLLVTGSSGGLPVTLPVDRAALGQGQVKTTPPDSAAAHVLVSSGASPAAQKLRVVNPETCEPCPEDRIGEIWISGPHVSRGYWKRPEETARTFQARLSSGEGLFLRTGDLGFLREGNLFVTGRLKDVIIIRGRNHYPQDIERTVERCHPALRPGGGAAFSVETDGEERLVVAHEIDRRATEQDPAPIIQAIRRAIAEEHELQTYGVWLLPPGSIFKTSSGKIQRRACRDAFLSNELEAVASSFLPVADAETEDEAAAKLTRETLLAADEPSRHALLVASLRARLARSLGLMLSSVDADQPLTVFGLDSLMALEIKHEMESSLGVELPLIEWLQGPSINRLAAQILERTADSARTASRVEPGQTVHEYPLSYGQRALWFLYKLAPTSAAYNIANAVRIRGELDAPALQRALQALVDRHAALRVLFADAADQPVQRLQERAELCFRAEDASGWSEDDLRARLVEEAHRPLDLERGPLLRTSLFTRSSEDHVLQLVVHHIVADFWSLAVLVHELGPLYQAERTQTRAALAPCSARYVDYIRWEEQLMAREGERLWARWRERLSGELPVLDLPMARPRPPVQTFRGAARGQVLSAELTLALKRLGRAHGATLYTILLAAFQVLLHRYTGQSDLIVGSPMAGRTRPEFAGLVGYCVNSVPLRANLSGNPAFAGFLGQVRQVVLAAQALQEYPFPLLVERLDPKRDPSRSPLFQVMFVLQQSPPFEPGLAGFALGQAGAQWELDGLPIESVPLEQRAAQFDLTLMMAEANGCLHAAWQYNTDLFDEPAIARMAGHFETLLTGVVANPQQRLSDLPLLTEAERHTLLAEWNRTEAALRGGCLQTLVEAQAEQTPDAVAVVDGGDHLTYREMNRRANRLAHDLQSRGVGPEVLVAVCLERSVEMVVSLLAVLKAGGAYVPLDPAYPKERLSFILADTRAALLLTRRRLIEQLPAPPQQVVYLETDAGADETNPRTSVAEGNLAYVIYTSGSTGKPKGVAIEHRSAATLVQWAHTVFEPECLARTLASTSICFDLSVFELFVPLSGGGTVVLAENALDVATATEQSVTLVNTVPCAMKELLRLGRVPDSVRVVNLAGEPLPVSLVQDLYRRPGVQRVYDLYGPSEDTTYSTFACRSADGPATIGRPIANTRVYLLDSAMQPVPVGLPGEIHIGGDGLARGYLGQPGLTAEKFIPDPFSAEPGVRLYKTGDLARYRPDGNLEFIGRIDHQVKLRGFRIELGEIEAVLNQHPAVQESVAAVREDLAGERRLVAYVVPRPVKAIVSSELRAVLQAHLPEYMVLSTFTLMEALPHGPNGKVDRRALPEPERVRPASEAAFFAPRTPVEERLAEIWRDALKLDAVGVDDSFFGLGGSSLLMAQMAARIQDAFQIELPLATLLRGPTIAELATAVERILLEEIEALSDDEALALTNEQSG